MTQNTLSNTTPKTLLALDYGIKKMGMALGNSLTQDARPFDILAMNNGQPDWENLMGIIDTWQIDTVIIGLPLNMDGSDSILAKRAAKFARRLAHQIRQRHLDTNVMMIDERLSSQEARQLAWTRGLINTPNGAIDDVAACLLLNSYFYAPTQAVLINQD